MECHSMDFSTNRVECIQDDQVGDSYKCTYTDELGNEITPDENWTTRVVASGDLEMIAAPGMGYASWVVVKSDKMMKCVQNESTDFFLKCTA